MEISRFGRVALSTVFMCIWLQYTQGLTVKASDAEGERQAFQASERFQGSRDDYRLTDVLGKERSQYGQPYPEENPQDDPPQEPQDDPPPVPGVCPILIPEDPPLSGRQFVESSAEHFVGTTKPRIVGGLPISPNLAPFLVALKDPGKVPAFACSGTLISPRFVLTAAHCRPQKGWIAAALTTSGLQGGVEILVEEVFTHPKFFITPEDFFFDFSILKLAQDAPSGSKFMKLNRYRNLPRTGSPIRAMGYGFQFESAIPGGPGGDFSLRQVDVLTVSPRRCRAAYAKINLFPSRRLQICGGVATGGCDACQGDSGGPIVQYQYGEPIHMGLSSFGNGCGLADFPGVYARTSALLKWVAKSTPAVFETN